VSIEIPVQRIEPKAKGGVGNATVASDREECLRRRRSVEVSGDYWNVGWEGSERRLKGSLIVTGFVCHNVSCHDLYDAELSNCTIKWAASEESAGCTS
jgi:hypothetical protein